MKITNLLFVVGLICFPGVLCASDLFHDDVKYMDGIDVHAVSVFYLSDNKEKALKALQDFSNAVKSLGKDDKVTIKDFKGSPFEISYASKVTYGKPNFVLFKFFDPNIELVNKYGTKFRGAMFTGSTIVLDKAVKKQDKWK